TPSVPITDTLIVQYDISRVSSTPVTVQKPRRGSVKPCRISSAASSRINSFNLSLRRDIFSYSSITVLRCVKVGAKEQRPFAAPCCATHAQPENPRINVHQQGASIRPLAPWHPARATRAELV